jgi:hypothetical protein
MKAARRGDRKKKHRSQYDSEVLLTKTITRRHRHFPSEKKKWRYATWDEQPHFRINESTRNNRGTVGNGVFCTVRAKAV